MGRYDRFAETEYERHTVERLIERVKKLEEQSKEMQQLAGSGKEGASSKGENDDEDPFGWCRWRGSSIRG